MKIKIVCWGTEKEVFNAIKERGLYKVYGDDCKKSYHIIEENKIEVIMLDDNLSMLYKECSGKCKSDVTVLFINHNDQRKDEIIKKVKSINKDITILEKCDNIKFSTNIDYEDINYIYFIKDQFNINSIVYFILDNYDNDDKNHGVSGLKQSEVSYEDLIREILKNLCCIKDYKSIQLNLHLKSLLGIEELAYMEDILKEYIVKESMLIIKQFISINMDNEIYFNLIYG